MNQIKTQKLDLNYLLIAGLSALILIPFLGRVHLFDWDEINFAESAREMLVSGDYLNVQINFIPFWEKPPLFIWMQGASMKVFGVNEFAARFPNAIAGIFTVIALYHIGKKLFDKKFGGLWVMVYLGSILPFFYFKSGIIDPWFNFFIFLSIYFFNNYISYEGAKQKLHASLLSGALLGLAVLTKGPVAILLFSLSVSVFVLLRKFKIRFSIWHLGVFTIALLLTGGFWFIMQIITGNADIIWRFITYQIELLQTKGAGHGGFFGYHFVIILLGVFPASLFALPMFKRNSDYSPIQSSFKTIMIILLFVVLIVFTIVKTKIVHYSSMAYFPVTFLATCFIHGLLSKKWRTPAFMNLLIVLIGLILFLSFILLTLIAHFKDDLLASGLIKDRFASANLMANVQWSGFEILIGFILLTGVILYSLFILKKRPSYAIYSLFLSSFLFINLSLVFIVNNIEGYSQRAAIEFYKSIRDEDAYILPLGFKTYGHYFYAQTQEHNNPNYYNRSWLLEGEVDKDVYLITKIHYGENLMKTRPDLELVYAKNGFIFLKRK
ncbi:glycosyl transferase [Marivirga lumbricoides]|uniref:Glycosyl transferase n=1 Tax=Marivirga lumbricoides TaxID=1046115 RepID=A0A2T4DQ99_9BACT|nr:glycosyl transferase [Marivirga lumbricoides]